MKTCYMIYEHRAIADLCKYEDGYIITRICVPPEYRGRGDGSKLLKQITSDADKSNTILYIEINPYGQMTYEQLEAWYKRYGFEGNMLYVRVPNFHNPRPWIKS